MDSGFCLACVLLGHEFAKDSKVKLLRTDPVRSSPSAVSDFKRHVEGKRKKKDSDRNRTLHNDTSALLYTQPANIGPQEVPKTSPSNVPRTSPKDSI